MKYENPTCEVVLLDSADCLTVSVNKEDTPFIAYPNY